MAFKPYELEPALLEKARYKSLITESVEKKLELGRELREKVPREEHSEWIPPSNRRDPIEILMESNGGRMEDLIPIRHLRMMQSPFTFLRGSAAVMAYDLSNTPTTGLTVQACGDCHLSNFGLFATPERNLIFDVNDFDETIPGPWEWDLKRLVASIYVAYTQSGMSEKEAYTLSADMCYSIQEGDETCGRHERNGHMVCSVRCGYTNCRSEGTQCEEKIQGRERCCPRKGPRIYLP